MMVGNRKRKAINFGQTSAETTKTAMKLALKNGRSFQNTAKGLNIFKSSLQRYVQKAKQASAGNISYTPYYATRQAFDEKEEYEQHEYLVTSS